MQIKNIYINCDCHPDKWYLTVWGEPSTRESMESLKSQILQWKEKAEKYTKLIESFTFDFEPIDNIEEVARQFIDNEVRTTHKLYEENKTLESKIKQLEEELGKRQCEHDFDKGESGLGGNTIFTCKKCEGTEMDD